MNFRQDLLAHEKAASKLYQEKTGISPAYNRFGFIESLKENADLANYIENAFSTSESKQREKFYIEHGFRSYKQIIAEHGLEIENSKPTTIEDFKPGCEVTAYDICAATRNYNIQKGMILNITDPLHPFVVLKSEIGGVYSDNYTKDPRYYRYSLEKEKDASNFEKRDFKNPANLMLYNDFIRQDVFSQAKQIPAYLFIRVSGDKKYKFQGIYFVNNLIENNRMFELIDSRFAKGGVFSSSDEEYLRRFKEERVAYFDSLLCADLKQTLSGKKLIENPKAKRSPRSFTSFSYDSLVEMISDYSASFSLLQKIHKAGVHLAYEFECDRVKKIAPQQVKNISFLHGTDGFDLESFSRYGQNIRKVKIEVKSTTNRDPFNPFFLSKKQFDQIQTDPNFCWLYRVYDLNAPNPMLYALRENVSDSIRVSQSDFVCSIR